MLLQAQTSSQARCGWVGGRVSVGVGRQGGGGVSQGNGGGGHGDRLGTGGTLLAAGHSVFKVRLADG
jgi:hypothetical protein